MNENIDLTKILKDCPQDWKLYSSIWGEVRFRTIIEGEHPIVVELSDTLHQAFMANGRFHYKYDGECTLFPSREQRDWSKFTAPWYKKDKFDPETLKPFDKVIARYYEGHDWMCDWFSHKVEHSWKCIAGCYKHCIPYNDETKHLVGTTDEAPEYYRYWEDLR